MAESCIFCKIVAGDIGCARVYEDAETLAFLDINPFAEGHTLVVAKAHVELVTGLADGQGAALFAAVRKIARAQCEGLGADGVNVLLNQGRSAGQIVPHVHFHVIPRREGDGLSLGDCQSVPVSEERMGDILNKLTDALRSI